MKHLGILFLLLVACTSPKEKSENIHYKKLSPQGKKANLDQANSYNLITVEIGVPKEQVKVTSKHLHGNFFNDRAEFYVIENPELFISDSKVKELTLYFIDGVLCKKKYLLAEDISTELIKSYGGFKFIPLNHRTSDFAKSEYIVKKTEAGNVLNKKLDRFELKWDKFETMIRYHMNKDSLKNQIYLMEELSAYKYLLKTAEKELI